MPHPHTCPWGQSAPGTVPVKAARHPGGLQRTPDEAPFGRHNHIVPCPCPTEQICTRDMIHNVGHMFLSVCGHVSVGCNKSVTLSIGFVDYLHIPALSHTTILRRINRPLTRYVTPCVAHAPECRERFPATDFKGNRQLAIPVCVTHVPDACRDRKRSRCSRRMRNLQFYVIWQEAHEWWASVYRRQHSWRSSNTDNTDIVVEISMEQGSF